MNNLTIRKKIDKIDQSIFKLIKKRTIIVKKMLTLKKYKNLTGKKIAYILLRVSSRF